MSPQDNQTVINDKKSFVIGGGRGPAGINGHGNRANGGMSRQGESFGEEDISQWNDEQQYDYNTDTDNDAQSILAAMIEADRMEGSGSRRFSCMADSDRHFSTEFSNRSEEGGEVARIVERENKLINPSRIAVVLLLLICGITLGLLAYFFGRMAEEEAATAQFDNMASQLITMSQNKVHRVYDVLESLSVTMTSSTTNNDKDVYPPGFITLPNVERQFGTARTTLEASQIVYTPFVADEERNQWQSYSEINNYWIIEANAAYSLSGGNGGSISNRRLVEVSVLDQGDDGTTTVSMDPTADQIWELSNRKNANGDTQNIPIPAPLGSGPYSPLWLISPPPPIKDTFIINYNLQNYSLFDTAVSSIQQTNQPFFGVDDNPNTNNPLVSYPEEKSSSSSSLAVEEKSNNPNTNDNSPSPTAMIVYPVFQDFFSSGSASSSSSSSSSSFTTALNNPPPPSAKVIIGHLASSIPVNVLLQNIFLPQDEDYPLRVVLGNTCNDNVISYKVSGNETEVWDTTESYDDNLLGGHHQSSVLVPDDECAYTIQVFPTPELVKEFETQEPILYLVVIMVTFIFAMLLFLCYDGLITKRQNKVILSAQKTQALVSTLFPKTVQERILNQGDTAHRGRGDPGDDDDDSYEDEESEPIADFFPHTTIMFADIAGFTAWSSIREPAQVFTLLETLYHDFDMIARRRRVFKVETIGDCYVAVCGCPNPIDDHHVVMSRFASDCLNTLQSITKKLEISLGVGTADLALRVGLHSGAVTAGVLRGERARFQLFGDTMNTASRMESTGIRNKIQVSQETADLLFASNKGKWLTEREGGVEAKGKGTLRTYMLFIPPKRKGSMTSSVATASFSPDNSAVELLSADDSVADLLGPEDFLVETKGDSNGENGGSSHADGSSRTGSTDPKTSESSEGPGMSGSKNRKTSTSSDRRTSSLAGSGASKPPASPGTPTTAASTPDPSPSTVQSSSPSPRAKSRPSHRGARPLRAKSGPSPRELAAMKNATKKRFVQYNTELLKKLLLSCAQQRKNVNIQSAPMEVLEKLEEESMAGGSLVIDELQDVIGLSEATPNPANDPTKPKRRKKKRVTIDIYDNPAALMNVPQEKRNLRRVSQKVAVELSDEVEEQLYKYITAIADAYPNLQYSNFEHASHVAMSVNKLMTRSSALHQETKTKSRSPEGILTDPLVQFAVMLSALIHDVDYPGVPNSQLIKEGSELATAYQNKSIGEQNSVDVAWKMLMSGDYEDLRHTIYTNKTEFELFRSLIVNAVIATDLFDPKLNENSKARWDKAFNSEGAVEEDQTAKVDRKTTMIIECIIQASDLSHTMQHWSIYRKWDEKLFEEMYKAYQDGRSDSNPATVWHQGQLAFFDYYVLPLANKLKECAVFGVSSDEYLSCAKKNREEWQRRGTEIVAEMVAKVEGGA